MIIDCTNWASLPDHGESQRKVVLVNGVRIPGVWYLDTEKGFVKTYFLGNATTVQRSAGFDRSKYPADWEIDTSQYLVSRIIRGKVTLQPVT